MVPLEENKRRGWKIRVRKKGWVYLKLAQVPEQSEFTDSDY